MTETAHPPEAAETQFGSPVYVLEERAPPEPLLISVKHACALLSFGRTKVFSLLAANILERRRIAGCTRVTMRSVKRLVES